jgi:hypothetical protein
MNSFVIRSAIAASAISLLAACGGGSSGGGAATGPSLNLNAAYASFLTNGSSAAFTLSGDCTGTSVETSLPAYAGLTGDASPISVLVVDKIQVDTISSTSRALAACNQIYSSNDGNQVFRDFYNPTTKTIVNKGFDSIYEFYTNQAALPASVTVGSTGVIYTSQSFNGASTTTGTPSQAATYSYTVAADTATTLLVTFTSAGRDGATGKAIFTDSTTYRLNANNTLTPLSKAITTTADLTGIGALSISATAAAAPAPLNLGTAQIAFLNSASSAQYDIFKDGEQCGTASVANSAISNSTTVTSFTSNITDPAACTFALPNTATTTYGSAFQFVSSVIVGTDTNGNPYNTTNTATSTPVSTTFPNNVTIGASGSLYDYTRSASSTTGSVTYFVGAAASSGSLTVYEITTKNYGQGFVGREIVASTVNSSNAVAPGNVYLEENYTLVPN